MPVCGTVDTIFILQEMQEKYLSKNTEVEYEETWS
jgi:hypothetical protein